MLRNSLGQSGRYLVFEGQKVISTGNLVQLSYFLIAGAIAQAISAGRFLCIRHPCGFFTLAAFFLIGSAFLDFGMINGHHVWPDPRGTVSDGVFKTVEESLKVAGFAMVLGGLMEKLLQCTTSDID